MVELKTQLEQLGQQLAQSDEARQQLTQQLQDAQQRCVAHQVSLDLQGTCTDLNNSYRLLT